MKTNGSENGAHPTGTPSLEQLRMSTSHSNSDPMLRQQNMDAAMASVRHYMQRINGDRPPRSSLEIIDDALAFLVSSNQSRGATESNRGSSWPRDQDRGGHQGGSKKQ